MIGNLIHFKKSKVQNFYPVFAIILLIIYDFLHTMFCSCFFALTPLLHAKFKENFFFVWREAYLPIFSSILQSLYKQFVLFQNYSP